MCPAKSAAISSSPMIRSVLDQSSKSSEHILNLAITLAVEICKTPSAFISLKTSSAEIIVESRNISASKISLDNPLYINTLNAPSIFIADCISKSAAFLNYARCFTEHSIEFYAGLPLRNSEGAFLGTLAVLDTNPRELTSPQRDQLETLARQIVATLQLMEQNWKLQSEREQLTTDLASSKDSNSLLSVLAECQESFVQLDYDPRIINRALEKIIKLTHFEIAIIAVVDASNLTQLCHISHRETDSLVQIQRIVEILSETTQSREQQVIDPLDPISNALGLRNVITVPLVSHFGVVGVLALANHPDPLCSEVLEPARPAIPFLTTLIEAHRLRKLQLKTTIRLEELERQQHLIIKRGHIATWDWSLSQDLITWNERWFEICGWSSNQLDGSRNSLVEIIHPDDRDKVQFQMQQHLTDETPSYECEYRILAADGTWRWLLDQGEIASRDLKGMPSRICGIYFDITDRMSATQALKSQAERLKQLNLIAAAGLKGFEWQINETLRCVAEILNLKIGLVSILEGDILTVEHSFGGPPPGTKLTLANTFYQLTVESGGSFAISDVAQSPYNKHPAYTESNIRSYISCPLQVTGCVMGTVSFSSSAALQEPFSGVDLDFMSLVGSWISSLYERQMLDLSLVSINSELERSNQELDEFAYVVSHDLKAPLRGIANLAVWIEEDSGEKLTANSKRDLQSLQKRATRLQKMLGDLLEYAKTGKGHSAAEAIDSREMIEDIVDLMGEPMKFTVLFIGDFPTLRLPRAPVEKIFRNLISNAMKHHDKDTGTITIEARLSREKTCEFLVKDDGPGIPLQYHQHVFKLFSRLKSQDEVEGSGLGLSFVKKTVESLGGAISISSQGRGTTFHLKLPHETV